MNKAAVVVVAMAAAMFWHISQKIAYLCDSGMVQWFSLENETRTTLFITAEFYLTNLDSNKGKLSYSKWAHG